MVGKGELLLPGQHGDHCLCLGKHEIDGIQGAQLAHILAQSQGELAACFLALVRTGIGLLVLGDQREKAGVLTDLPAEITDLLHHIIHQERGPIEVGIDQI